MTGHLGNMRRWGVCLLLAVGLAGCASLKQEWTEKMAHWQIYDRFYREDPLVVLRDSTNGTKRANALGELQEPQQHGGTAEAQEVYVQLLTTSAKTDPEPLCRLRAIRTLGRYKDPRAAQCLEEVYFQRLPFTADLNTIVRQQTLASLEETGDPRAREVLIKVARQPGSAIDSSLSDRQQTLDERLAALRGLAKFPQYDAIETLVDVMEKERDAALRERAHQSLKEATGKDLPAEAAQWRALLATPGGPALAREPEANVIQRVLGLPKAP